MKRLKFLLLILTSLLFTVTHNYGQSASIDKFDIKKFDSEKIYNKQSQVLEVNDTLKDGTTIKQFEDGDYYIEKIQLLNSPIIQTKAYFKDTGNLEIISKTFYSFPIGSTNEYNRNGKLIKQTKWDKNFSFSIDDLSAKLKKEFDIDIMHTNQALYVSVVRGFENGSYYSVSIGKLCKCEHRFIRIDGNSGKVLSNKIQPYPDDSGSQ